MDVYLLDGTYELFRHFYAVPSHVNDAGEEVAATRGVLASVIGMLESGITHIGVATDHVIESFRNDMWPGYKTGEGVDPRLLAQFIPLEQALESMGIATWPMVELEADDAIAAAAVSLAKLSDVDRVIICSPDKDFAQCIRGDKIVQLNRRTGLFRNEAGVQARFGIPPSSIPDYLALVGDTADGYAGLDGWGEKASATVLGEYGHLEKIPPRTENWKVQVRRADLLASTLRENFKLALLFRDLATLRTRKPKLSSTSKVHWKGPRPSFPAFCKRLDAPELKNRVDVLVSQRG
ncbi:flap endonuclease [Candidatus Bathyarchaeota archaeon]|nr:MAG: flap endonuclease [Candidatus Bathyarchaeota archaeon]